MRVGDSVAPCCMPLWNVRQLKRKQFESLSQITQQHLATCRISCGKLQLQLSAPFVLFLFAIIIFKSFSEYSCNTHSGNLNCTCRRPKLPCAVCLENHKLSREILAVHATNGATKSEKKVMKRREEKRKKKEWNSSKTNETKRATACGTCNTARRPQCFGCSVRREAWQVCSAPDKCPLHANKLQEQRRGRG